MVQVAHCSRCPERAEGRRGQKEVGGGRWARGCRRRLSSRAGAFSCLHRCAGRALADLSEKESEVRGAPCEASDTCGAC